MAKPDYNYPCFKASPAALSFVCALLKRDPEELAALSFSTLFFHHAHPGVYCISGLEKPPFTPEPNIFDSVQEVKAPADFNILKKAYPGWEKVRQWLLIFPFLFLFCA